MFPVFHSVTVAGSLNRFEMPDVCNLIDSHLIDRRDKYRGPGGYAAEGRANPESFFSPKALVNTRRLGRSYFLQARF
jgi:hypothetical protein